MKAIIQRVKRANVIIDNVTVGSINTGIVVLLGITHTDGIEQIQWISNKIANLRIFDDENGVMNKSLLEIANSGILFVSNFTLYGNTKKGFRPSYIEAAPGEISQPIYNQFLQYFSEQYSDHLKIQSGVFGAMMDVELVNDGPVTLIVEKQ